MTTSQDDYGMYIRLLGVGTEKVSGFSGSVGGTLSATFSSAAIDGRAAVGGTAYSFQRSDDGSTNGVSRGFEDSAETPCQIIAIEDAGLGKKMVTVAPQGWKPFISLEQLGM
jgi:hypothetical protein